MRWFVLLSLLFVTLIFPSSSRADSPIPPHDYTQVAGGGTYIFVMLTRDKPASTSNQSGTRNHAQTIRKTYTESGLYLNDGSTTPLWTIDWYASEVMVSSDGHSLVRWGPWPSIDNYGELAVAFYTDGKQIQYYQVDDLVAVPQTLPESVSHYQWRKYDKPAAFDDQRHELSLATLNGEHYVFDVRSGDIVRKEVVAVPTPTAITAPPEAAPVLNQSSLVSLPLIALAACVAGLLIFFGVRRIREA